ncbi:MAG: phosphotransferase [Candidatus Paceibacterota bacterium]
MEDKKTIQGALEKIRKSYAVAKKAELTEIVKKGYLSNNFILRSDEKKLFLKQYRFDDIEKIKEVHRVKFFFSDGGIPIILPIRNNEGDFIFEDAGKLYSLFPFIEGRIIRKEERSQKAFASAGEMLGRIHILSKDSCPHITDCYGREWDKKEFLVRAGAMKERVEKNTERTNFNKMALKTINLKISLAEGNNVRYEDLELKKDHIIHGDYHGQNIFYDNNDEVSYVFDIEKTEISSRILEIARTIDYMCFSNNYKVKNFNDARIFLSAYNKVYPFCAEELTRGIEAYYIKKAHSIWIEEEHYTNNNFRVDCFLEGEFLMLSYYSKNFKNFTDRLTNI